MLSATIAAGALLTAFLLAIPARAARPEKAKSEKTQQVKSVSQKKSSVRKGAPPQLVSMQQYGSNSGKTYPLPRIEPARYTLRQDGTVLLGGVPSFNSVVRGRVAGIGQRNEYLIYSISPGLQSFVDKIVREARAPHVAAVVMNPRTGSILAIADKSPSITDLSLHSGFPAASIFKLVTTTAAVENAGVEPLQVINFRGGTYTLNQWNYKPNPKADLRRMPLAEALGRSCNPVFGRVALRYLSPPVLRTYAEQFGFNRQLGSDLSVKPSSATIPPDDLGLSLTAAGFGDVTLSPVHAAALMSGIANDGLLPRPSLVEQIIQRDGKVLYRAAPVTVSRIMTPRTSRTVMNMMQYTTTMGTSRREFMRKNRPLLPVRVAAKTGTLSGPSPEGLNNWFVAAAPLDNPTIAVAVVVVTPRGYRRAARASHLGKLIIERSIRSRHD